MRGPSGYVCMFLGTLFLVLGITARPVLYAQLARVPLDQRSVSTSVGTGMSALSVSPAGVKVITDATIRSTRNVIGIPGRATGNNAFWQTTVQSTAIGVGDLAYSQETVSFDRTSGESTNCCGDVRSAGDLGDPDRTVPIAHRGLFFKFPFDTRRTTYQWWDGDLSRAEPIRFLRTESIQGLKTYVFQQRSGPEPYGPANGVRENLPGSLFGRTVPVTATAMFEITRTLWVEPNTGVVIKGEERQDKRLEAPGLAPVPITKGTIAYTDETVTKNVAEWGGAGRALGFVNNHLTWLGVLLGVVLLGVGGYLSLGPGADTARSRRLI